MPKLLTISPYVSSRPISGGTRRIHFLNKGLAQAGWDVFQFSASGMGKTGPFRSREFRLGERYVEYRYVNPALVVGNRILKECGAPHVAPSFLPSFVYHSGVLKREMAARNVVMFEHPHYWDWGRKLLRPGQKIVADAHNIEFLFHDADRAAGGLKGMAARRLHDMERELFRRADLIFTCTQDDLDKAVEAFGVDRAKFLVVPNGTDVEGTPAPSIEERRAAKARLGFADRPVALFTGSRWPPNTEAALAIVDMAASLPEIDFVIAGRVAEALPEQLPLNIRAPGFVDDLADHFAAADIALNPMLSGGGSNVKLFDYLAAGLPVISTPFGARGVEGEDGAVTRAELGGFPDAIRALAGSPEIEARRLAARRLAGELYDWRAISARAADALMALIPDKSE